MPHGTAEPDDELTRKIREAILTSDAMTVYGEFKVDEEGFHVARKMVTFQW